MSQKKNQFSTFAGVFTPSILSILGVIMFLLADGVIGESDVLFLGLQASDAESSVEFYDRTTRLLEPMPTTILVHPSGEADVFT